jgi:predicted kinase
MADRAPVIALARRHGAKVVGYFVDVPVKDALARNSGRDGRERVPNVAIYTIARRLEPPSPAEGFDELYRVQPAGDGEFTVERLLTAPESPSER